MRDTAGSMLPCRAQTAQVGGGHKEMEPSRGGHRRELGAAGESGWDREVWGVRRGGSPRECAGWETRRWKAVDSSPKEGDRVIW